MNNITQYQPKPNDLIVLLDKIESLIDKIKFTEKGKERNDLIDSYIFFSSNYNTISEFEAYNINFIPDFVSRPKPILKPKII
jgi:hypothetical protein